MNDAGFVCLELCGRESHSGLGGGSVEAAVHLRVSIQSLKLLGKLTVGISRVLQSIAEVLIELYSVVVESVAGSRRVCWLREELRNDC